MAKELTAGAKAPDVVNVIIEIRKGEHNKYEYDKETGYLTLDRVNGTALVYPTDYGYIPGTLCDDGDALDVLLVIDESVPQGVLVACRPIGVFRMVDNGANDEKLVVVAANDVSKDHVNDLADLGENFKQVNEHFYIHYKDWKDDWKGEVVSSNGWGDAAEAKRLVLETIEKAKTA